MNSLLQFLTVAIVLAIVGGAPTQTLVADTSSEVLTPTQSLMLPALLAPRPVVHDAAAVDEHHRQRRQSYNSPNSDYYSNYYNDYYNNYYNNQNNAPAYSTGNSNYNQYRPASADRFDGNTNSFNAIDSNSFASNGQPQPQVINGQKYTYTPLFQYKATQGHHQKLFVPNLFG